MADCLVYWKEYWKDYKQYGESALNPEWYTKYRAFPHQIGKGDSLWVVVWGGEDHPDEWRLIQRIYVKSVIFDPDDKQWHAVGDERKSETFDIKNQPDFGQILHTLRFASGKALSAKGKAIGRSIQRSRPLSHSDIGLLRHYANTVGKRQISGPQPLEQANLNQEWAKSQAKSGVSTEAGFGEAEKNLQVEQAAISCVTGQYVKQGWQVQSVEQDRQGFDLICNKGNKEEHVEVKGISGNTCSFIITTGEVERARKDPRFVLWVVTEALSQTPRPSRFTGKEFLQEFSLEPLEYRAVLKGGVLPR
jgi:hypothetical protein